MFISMLNTNEVLSLALYLVYLNEANELEVFNV